MKLAFYKGEGDFTDLAIRKWTKSPYSHVELIDDEGYWISTSPRLQSVTRRKVDFTEDSWDFIDVEVDEEHLLALYERVKGAKYDWTGIAFSQVIHLDIHRGSRWFCSEFCAAALKLPNANRYSPGSLYEFVISKQKDKL